MQALSAKLPCLVRLYMVEELLAHVRESRTDGEMAAWRARRLRLAAVSCFKRQTRAESTLTTPGSRDPNPAEGFTK